MNTPTTDSLANAMKAGLDERPAGRLRGMVDQERPGAFAVPSSQDAYEIALDHIEPDPKQPRRIFDDDELRNLADSIRENGLLQPIVVYRVGEAGRYRIIAGERRYRAAMLAGRSTVPCLEMPPDFDPALVDQFQLVENIQRADLYPVEASEAIEGYLERHNLSQREAAHRLGKPLSFVAELLAIRKIPGDLLARDGVARLPKQVLVEIGRAPEAERARLVGRALSGSSLDEIRGRRSNRHSPRLVYFSEQFLLEGCPPVEIRWKKAPDAVTDHDLIEVLSAVARLIASRGAERPFELRTPR